MCDCCRAMTVTASMNITTRTTACHSHGNQYQCKIKKRKKESVLVVENKLEKTALYKRSLPLESGPEVSSCSAAANIIFSILVFISS